MAVRSTLNFTGGGQTVTDDAANDRLNVNVPAPTVTDPSLVTGATPGIKVWIGTEAAYAAVSVKDPNTLYYTYASPGLVQDLYARNVTDGLGSAPTGGAYTVAGTGPAPAPGSDIDVISGYAQVVNPSANNDRYGLLTGVSQRDVDVKVRLNFQQLVTSGGAFSFALARVASTSQLYRLRAQWSPTNVTLTLQKVVAGTATDLTGSPSTTVTISGLTPTANQDYWMRLTASGATPTSLAGYLWQDGTTAPASPQVTASDSDSVLQAAAGVGWYLRLGSASGPAPFTWRVKELVVP